MQRESLRDADMDEDVVALGLLATQTVEQLYSTPSARYSSGVEYLAYLHYDHLRL
jgi:hypothetical protein